MALGHILSSIQFGILDLKWLTIKLNVLLFIWNVCTNASLVEHDRITRHPKVQLFVQASEGQKHLSLAVLCALDRVFQPQ